MFKRVVFDLSCHLLSVRFRSSGLLGLVYVFFCHINLFKVVKCVHLTPCNAILKDYFWPHSACYLPFFFAF